MKFRAGGCTRGFSYLELLVVVGLIGVVAAVSIPTLNNALERNRVFTSTELIAAQVREARLSAITKNATFRVRFDCPDGAIRFVVITGIGAIDNAPDRCTTRQPNDGLPVYLPPGVTLGTPLPTSLDINGRGQVSAVNGGGMPQNFSITHGSHTRTVVVWGTGRITTPAP